MLALALITTGIACVVGATYQARANPLKRRRTVITMRSPLWLWDWLNAKAHMRGTPGRGMRIGPCTITLIYVGTYHDGLRPGLAISW